MRAGPWARASPAGKAQGAVERPLLDRPLGGRHREHPLRDALRSTTRTPGPWARPDTGEDRAPRDGAQPPRHRRPTRLRRPPRRHPCSRGAKALADQAVDHARQRNRRGSVVAQRYAASSHHRHRARAVSAPVATHPERVHCGLPARVDRPAHLPRAKAVADQPQWLPGWPTRLATSRAARRTRDVHRRDPLRPGLDVDKRMNDDRCAPLLQDVSERDGRKAAKPGPPVTFLSKAGSVPTLRLRSRPLHPSLGPLPIHVHEGPAHRGDPLRHHEAGVSITP